MADDQWLSAQKAIEIIRRRIDTSIGRAEAILQRARASGEVRAEPSLLMADDGVVGMYMRPGNPNAERYQPRISEADFLDWLTRREEPQETKAPKRSQGKRDRAREAIAAKWPAGIPDAHKLPNDILCREVNDWVKADCKKQSIPPVDFSNDTILRADMAHPFLDLASEYESWVAHCRPHHLKLDSGKKHYSADRRRDEYD